MAGAQRQLGEFATTQDAVHVFVDQVHLAVAGAKVELDVRVARVEVG